MISSGILEYSVIVQPLQSLKGQPKIWCKVVGAWTMAFIFAIPQLFIFVQTDEGIHIDGSIVHQCKSNGYQQGQDWQRQVYFTFLTMYILVIPAFIISFCYFNIVRIVFIRAGEHPATPKLKFTSTRRPNDSRQSSSETYSELECTVNETTCMSDRGSRQWSGRSRLNIPKKAFSSSKQNIVKMTLSVIIAFIVCWSPYFVIGLIRIFSDYRIKLKQVYSIAELMAMFHSLLNPIIYGTFSRKAIAKTLRTSLSKRNKEKIVIDISLGSDFDSLVFVTNPDLYIDQTCQDTAVKATQPSCFNCFKSMFSFGCDSLKCSKRPFRTYRQSHIELQPKSKMIANNNDVNISQPVQTRRANRGLLSGKANSVRDGMENHSSFKNIEFHPRRICSC